MSLSRPATGTIMKSIMPVVREEAPENYEAIRNLNRIAFRGNIEAELADRLRSAGLVVVSLVAIENNEIVGHILFSELPIETDHDLIDAVSLAPTSVNPKWQRQGIGSALMRQGLQICRERGKAIVVVLGHLGYYP